MRRLILGALLFVMAAVAQAGEMPEAPPLHPSPAFQAAGPASAAGAVVWLHGGYDREPGVAPPPEPPWIGRLASDHYDIWRFDRPDRDPLQPGGDNLVRGLGALKAAGYRRIIVAGHSRGAFIALYALAEPGLVDALAAISPAAHGTSPSMRTRAMADFAERLAAAKAMRFAMVQLRDDDFDPDPDGRGDLARAAAARAGLQLMLIDRPAAPTGHTGAEEPAFDDAFGACLAAFLEGTAGPDACAAR